MSIEVYRKSIGSLSDRLGTHQRYIPIREQICEQVVCIVSQSYRKNPNSVWLECGALSMTRTHNFMHSLHFIHSISNSGILILLVHFDTRFSKTCHESECFVTMSPQRYCICQPGQWMGLHVEMCIRNSSETLATLFPISCTRIIRSRLSELNVDRLPRLLLVSLLKSLSGPALLLPVSRHTWRSFENSGKSSLWSDKLSNTWSRNYQNCTKLKDSRKNMLRVL